MTTQKRESPPAEGDRKGKDDADILPHRGVKYDPDKPPPRMPVKAENVPEELRALNRWVCWRWVWDATAEKGRGKWTKPPMKAAGRGKASSTDPTTWTTFTTALQAAPKFSGVGVALVENANPANVLTGVDLDNCLIDGKLKPWAQRAVDLLDSYTEVSPSGTGVRVFVFGKKPGDRCRKGDVELYHSGRYLTVTGHHLPGTPKSVNKRQDELSAFYAETFAPPKPEPEYPAEYMADRINVPVNNTGAPDLVAIARKAKNGAKFSALYDGQWQNHYTSQSEADAALLSMLAFYTGKNASEMDRLFRASALMRDKWDRQTGDSTYGAREIASAISRCTETFNPEARHNKQEQKQEAKPTPRTLRERLEAMRSAGPRIPTGIEHLDHHLRGGLRLEKLAVLGGAPGAGKTTLMLQIAVNMARAGVAVAFVASDEEAAGLDSRLLQSIGIPRDAAEEPSPEVIEQADVELGDLPLMILEDCTVEDAFALLAEAHHDKPRCVMLDSLQTCQTAFTRDIDNPRERIDDVVKTAKRLARQPETRAVVVATSELARGAYRNKRAADAMNDLAAFKESGGVEYAAHVALVLRTIEGSNTDVHAAVVKNRLGTRGDFMLYLDLQAATFTTGDAVDGGASGAQKTATFRQRVANALNAITEAPDGISSYRVHQLLGGGKELTLSALDELRSGGVIYRKGEKGPWRHGADWKERWLELQKRWDAADFAADPHKRRDDAAAIKAFMENGPDRSPTV